MNCFLSRDRTSVQVGLEGCGLCCERGCEMLRRCARGNALRVALRPVPRLVRMAAAVSVRFADLPIFKGQAPVRRVPGLHRRRGVLDRAATAFPISAAVCLETESGFPSAFLSAMLWTGACIRRSAGPSRWVSIIATPGTPWHINGQFRDGQTAARTASARRSASSVAKGPTTRRNFHQQFHRSQAEGAPLDRGFRRRL